MSLSFSGRVVVITGASRGIGLGIARRFAQAGATLHLIANDAAIHERARELNATGAEADIADREAVAAALAPLARIDVLVNNAGLELMTPVDDAGDDNEAAFRRIVEINVIGTALVTARALPRMPAGGSIVNTASIWGRVAEARFGA
ncbi:SDR family NAD(P)-dependent oxidoreductase, partial [Mesorhizobium sp. M2C.T.Ca.TU.002.02.1.1]|uniref:SDR family NAD(P)-dependent oxidoreductase n=1 Tax=Mesorhizobium sp. M2C.T.Ca.TU.002.02.1.1 TaxID=2496788 RepID=UPI000FCB34CB